MVRWELELSEGKVVQRDEALAEAFKAVARAQEFTRNDLEAERLDQVLLTLHELKCEE